MTKYDVSYDLPREGQNYSGLTAALRAMGARKYQLSSWYLYNSLSAQQLHDLLSVHIDANDRLKVAEINPANSVSTNEIDGFSSFIDLFCAAPASGGLAALAAKSAIAAALVRHPVEPLPQVGILSGIMLKK